MDKLGMFNSVLTSVGSGIAGYQKYKNREQEIEDKYDVAQDQIESQTSNATTFNQLTQEFNNLQWSNFNPELEDYIGSGAENVLGIGSSVISSAISGVKSSGSLWGALNAIPDLAGNLAGYFTAKNRAASNMEYVKQRNEEINEKLTNRYNYRASAISQNNMNNTLLNIAAEGGYVPTRDFTNGMTFFSEGGSHEENPYQGIQQGIAPDGKPNLVEEGEWKYKDYIYSKRLKVPKKDYEMLGLKEGKEYTYADAAEAIQKESEERPNDPISIRNLDAMMGRLQNSQETFKQKRDAMKMKREFEKLSPEEQAYMIQAMSQPQQAVPAQAQYAANGGHLFWTGGDYETRPSVYAELSKPEWERLMFETYGPAGDDSTVYVTGTVPTQDDQKLKVGNTQYLTDENGNIIAEGNIVTPKIKDSTLSNNNFSSAQALRAMPVVGSAIGALASLFDKPNYSNIEIAERAINSVPKVAAGTIGQKLTYNPIDINYIATAANNQSIGARRAAIENSLGNSATALGQLPALNYTSQKALGDLFIQAAKENNVLKESVNRFNRETDSFNIENALRADIQNQGMDYNKANFLLKTGMLRDEELAKVQANKSASISNFLNNMGNLGQDKLNREMIGALIKDGVYNTLGKNTSSMAGNIIGAFEFGGNLRKKGGKHA